MVAPARLKSGGWSSCPTKNSPGSVYPRWRRDLNSLNRLVRTRMPGGVAGVAGENPAPLCRWVAFSSSATALRLEVADVGGRKAPGDAPQHAPGRAVQKREPLLDPAAHWMERYRSSLGGQRWSCTWEELQSLNSLVVQTDDERPRGCRLGIHFERS